MESVRDESHRITMRSSRVLKKLRRGEVVNCVNMNIDSSRGVEIAALMGFDCIWLDMEHTASDWGTIEKQILAAKAYDVDTLVRVSRGVYSDYIKPLELDATGIIVPHIMSLADAQNVVRMTRFHPIGRRPVDSGNADGAYCNINFFEYLKQANRERFVIIQIEDPEPMAELDAIAAVPGIDMLFFGPTDFSHGIGSPGNRDHPRVVKARKLIAAAARRHGIAAGTAGSPDGMHELIDLGYRFINIGSDVVGLSRHFKTLASQWQQGLQKRKSK